MRVFLIGPAGGVGRRLAAELTRNGDQVTGLHRNPDQEATIRATGATPVLGDLTRMTVDELADLMRGHDAVVFSAGARGAPARKRPRRSTRTARSGPSMPLSAPA